MRKLVSALLISSALVSVDAFAEPITGINISGNKRVEAATVRSFLGISEGMEVGDDEIAAALKNMFDTGLFKNIDVNLDGSKLNVSVEENPVISQVKVEGNDKIDQDTLLQELELAPRSIYSEAKVQADVNRILSIYQRQGRFDTRVEPKIVEQSDNRVDLVYEVSEGKRSKIEQVSFVGNESFSDTELEDILSTKESRWYRFFSGSDNYDPDRLEYDKELVKRFYSNRGYADFKVLSADAEFNQDEQAFVVTFTVDEGKKYRLGKIDLNSKISEVPADELRKKVKTESGEIFSAERVENSITDVTEFLGDKGYAFVEINPVFTRNEADSTIDINYEIGEGPKVYVNKINISGNVRTMDEVIRREFRIAEGDPYNASKLKRSKQRIESLDFFNKVDIKNERNENPDRVDINVGVEEKSTGELTFGAGFSSSEGAIGDVSIRERNFLGKGQDTRLGFVAASSRQQVDFSFTEPYFMGREIAAGIDLFMIERSRSSYSNLTFDSSQTGVTLRAQYPITEIFSHAVRYTYKEDEIKNPDPTASAFVRRAVGSRTTSSFGHSLIYDKLDNRNEPTSGYYIRFNQDYAGIGGDVDYIKHELRSQYYTPLKERSTDYVLKLAFNAGNITGINGDDVNVNDRFFIGGNYLRGFDNQGVGPRDQASLDPLGGNTYYVGTAEVYFPNGIPKELGFKSSVFTDVGTLYGNDDPASLGTVLDSSGIRASVGVGISWRSPIGPMRVDLAQTLADESYDETKFFNINFGTKF
jgi:outer membrane protein insertion porin family